MKTKVLEDEARYAYLDGKHCASDPKIENIKCYFGYKDTPVFREFMKGVQDGTRLRNSNTKG